ncbi:hypothetical protein DY000_02021255 [Brassica cretica]|uniref:Uncharacterized protein n=1 Tax=Brassica cretica TaxID=69181 RepID=A0ABQ7E1W5_BRACR|nr:hypothetical protein DY000_02021255 [Brassica cretica]
MEQGPEDALMVADDHEDDLIGEDLMDMEASAINKQMVDVRMTDKGRVEKLKPPSSYKSGGRYVNPPQGIYHIQRDNDQVR